MNNNINPYSNNSSNENFNQNFLNTQHNDSQSKVNKKLKWKKRLKRQLIFLLIIALIIGIVQLKSYKDIYNAKSTLRVDTQSDCTIDDLTDEQLQEDWNNNGLINEEELKLGLDPTVSDSDGDGISDYDEINTYKTNPTKFSTSGDGYSDAYKIVNKMDVNKFYDFEDIKLKENNKITLSPKYPGDAELFVYCETNVDTLPIEQNYVDCFTFYSYNGDITYTINNAKNYSVYSIGMFDFNLKKIDCTYTDNSISFSNTNNCRILIYDNATISDMNQNNFNEIADFYVIMYPLFNFTGKQPIHVFYNSKDISPSKEELNQYFNKQAQQIYIDYCKKNGDKFEETFDLGFTTITISFPEFEFHPVSSARLALVKSNCNELDNTLTTSMISNDEFDEKTKSFLEGLKTLLYLKAEYHGSVNSLLGKMLDVDASEKNNNNVSTVDYSVAKEWNINKTSAYYADSGFDMNKHAFRFSNLVTEKANGVCSGFSYVTAMIYNSDISEKEKGKNDNGNYDYDITSSEYNVIKNGDLYNYLPSSDELKTYCDREYGNIKIDSLKLAQPDNEVVKMLEYHWKNQNDIQLKNNVAAGIREKMEYRKLGSFDSIEAVKDEFQNGKIVMVSLKKIGQGHAINAYKLEQSIYSDDVFYLRCYDNNFPCNRWVTKEGVKNVDVTIDICRIYKNNIFGEKEEYFVFDYMPVDPKYDYHYSNVNEHSDFNYIYFYDENNKLL